MMIYSFENTGEHAPWERVILSFWTVNNMNEFYEQLEVPRRGTNGLFCRQYRQVYHAVVFS